MSFERVGVKTRAVGVLRWCVRVPKCLFLGLEAVAVVEGFKILLVEDVVHESIELRV